MEMTGEKDKTDARLYAVEDSEVKRERT